MANSDYTLRPNTHGFCPVGYLSSDIGPLDTAVTMTGYTSPLEDGIRIGMAAMITSIIPTDPYADNVVLLVQGGADGSLLVQDRGSYGDSVTIANYAAFDNEHQVFGDNPIKVTTVQPDVPAFTSVGIGSRFGRAPGDKWTIECWVYWESMGNFAPSVPLWKWNNQFGRNFELRFEGNTGNLFLRNGDDGAVFLANIPANTLAFTQLNVDGTAYTIDVNGTQVGSGTNPYGVGSSGTQSFFVASYGIPSTTGSGTEAWVGPLRVTKGVLRPRGSIPTGPFQATSTEFNQEIVVVTARTGNDLTLGRGCCDTVPAAHSTGDAIWFFDDSIGSDKREYAGTETIGVKVLPRVTAGALPIEHAPPAEVEFNLRFARPYPPGLVEVNGDPWFTTPITLSLSNQTLTITWAHRDRITQQDQLIDHLEASIGPEVGTTYELRVYRADGTLLRTVVGETDTSWSYTLADAIVDFSAAGAEYPGYITLNSRRDGLASYQQYKIDFTLQSSITPTNPTVVGNIVSNETLIPVPSHSAGDMILVVHRNVSTGVPATLSGFTSLITTDPAFGYGSRAQWAIDTFNTIASISSAGGTLSVHVFTNCIGIGDAQVHDLDDVGQTAEFPALALHATDGSSSVFACLLTNQTGASRPTNPAAMTKLTDAQTPVNYGGGDFVTWISDGGVTSFSGKTSTWPPAAYWSTFAIELLTTAGGAPPPDTTESTLTLTLSLAEQQPGASIAMDLTQVATPISAGAAYVAIFYIPPALLADPAPIGRTIYANFGMGLNQAVAIESVLSYTTTAATSHADIIDALIAQANSATPLSSRGLRATANSYTGRPGMQISGPVGLKMHSTYGVMAPGVFAPVFTPINNLFVTEFSLGATVVAVALNQLVTATIGGTPTAGDRLTVTLNGVPFSYLASAGQTLSEIATALAAVIDVDANYSATAAGAVITIDGLTPANVFSYSGTSESPFAF